MKYTISLNHPEWAHTHASFNTKAEAVKEARQIRSIGSFFLDSESKETKENITVTVYDNSKNCTVYETRLTKKYINS